MTGSFQKSNVLKRTQSSRGNSNRIQFSKTYKEMNKRYTYTAILEHY